MNNLEIARERTSYACNLLDEAKVPYQVKNLDIGHINIYKDTKVVMSFWARTGKIIFTCPIEQIKKPMSEDDRGIKTLIQVYKNNFEN